MYTLVECNNFYAFYEWVFNPNSEFLQLDGIIESDTLHIIFSRKNHNKFNLNSHGFRWIN